MKEEVVTPPGSPPRREEPPARPGTPEQDINDDAVAHRVGRRRRFNQGLVFTVIFVSLLLQC